MDYNLGKFFHLSREMYCIITSAGLIKKVNPAFLSKLGWESQELIKRPVFEFIHPDDKEEIENEIVKMIPGISSVFNIRFRHKEGNYKKLYWTIHPEPKLLYTIVQETSGEKKAEKIISNQIEELSEVKTRLKELVMTDSLTKLKNRRAYFEQFEVLYRISCRQKRPLSLIILNLDDFKSYNDAYGPDAGDMVLKHIARVLLQSCRESDIAARYGGEEFAVLLPETDKIGAILLCERIQSSIETFQWRHRSITASFGLTTCYSDDKKESFSADIIRRIMAQADKALRLSKEKGKNRYTHFDDIGVTDELLC